MIPLDPLTTEDYQKLEASSWITREIADQARLGRVGSIQGSEMFGRNGDRGDYSGLIFPYLPPRQTEPVTYRLRLDNPPLEPDGEGFKVLRKYLAAPGDKNHLYYPPGTDPVWLEDPKLRLIFVEGEKKCLALSRLARHELGEGREPRFLVIGLSGVWNWRAETGHRLGPNGKPVPVNGPLPEFDRLNLKKRECLILFDTNLGTDESVQQANRQLLKFLKRRHAIPHTFQWLPDTPQGLNGADDYLAARGPQPLLDLIEKAFAGPNEASVLDPADPLPSARKFIQVSYSRDNVRLLQHQNGVFYQFLEDLGRYAKLDEAFMRSQLYHFLENALVAADGTYIPFKPTTARVNNVLDALRAVANLSASLEVPCWLKGKHEQKPLELIACRNGLLHIPTQKLLTATPDFFSFTGVDFDFDAKAPDPSSWFKFLNDLWPEDPESKGTLQEWFGCLLTPDTQFQKILMIVGPKRSGKGTIARTTRCLVGSHQVCGPTLYDLGQLFGREELIEKSLAIISDCRVSGKSDTALIAERLLSISGEDPITIPRKYLPAWNGILPTRFMVLTNELPRIEDVSGALASRFIVLTLERSFYGREDLGLFQRIENELPAILLWALDGWDRLRKRGRFVQPKSSAQLIQEFEDLGSPVTAFMRDCLEIRVGFQVSQERVFIRWKEWCEANGREHPGTTQSFARNLRAALPWLKMSQPRDGEDRIRCWEGLKLRS